MGFLAVTKAFRPSTDRGWVIHFWELPVKWIFAALPFGFLITILFYFDVSQVHQLGLSSFLLADSLLSSLQNNVSSLMAQSRAFPVKRPAGFHWVSQSAATHLTRGARLSARR